MRAVELWSSLEGMIGPKGQMLAEFLMNSWKNGGENLAQKKWKI